LDGQYFVLYLFDDVKCIPLVPFFRLSVFSCMTIIVPHAIVR